MVVGGFNGKFLGDYYFVKMDHETGAVQQITKNERAAGGSGGPLFPFQVPTIGDPAKRSMITIDWQNMTLHQFEHGSWTQRCSVK